MNRFEPSSRQRAAEAAALGVAFVGFTQQAQAQVFQWIEPLFGQRHGWSVTSVDTADALCVHGHAVQCVEGASVMLRPGPSGPASIRLDKPMRPVALAIGVCEDLPGCIPFDATSHYSVINVFRLFELRLAALRHEFALGALLASRKAFTVTGAVYHLFSEGHLVGVVDTANGVLGARMPLRPGALHAAEWRRRPEGAAEIPGGFARWGFTDLLWTYASRAKRHVLPLELRTATMALNKLPEVPMDRLNAMHVKVMAAIRAQPLTLDELFERIDGSRDAVSRCVAALYQAGALSAATGPGARSGRLESMRRFFLGDARASFFAAAG